MKTSFLRYTPGHAVYPAYFFPLVFAFFLLTPFVVNAQESDCLYEFNKAYANNEYGTEQIQTAQEHVAANQFESAKTHYRKAIDILQEAIKQYENLPKVALDCSPANLTIAKNNIRIAQGNLQLANEALLGIDCFAEIGKLEELSLLASDYYYKHNDPESAKIAAEDALQYAETIKEKNICVGSYKESLDAQIKYARQINDSLKARAQYDRCEQGLTATLTAESKAKQSSLTGDKTKMRNSWSEVVSQADKALQDGSCRPDQRSQLQSLKQRASDKLKSFSG